ncbi:TIGR02391 family protein [Micromonospora sp. CPCC 205547]|uniref:TIGR02391 family protein n=1 Tax=Micromonospora sp. CPCC 205547 TaxID=3122400 RepID=UPI003B968C84
MLFKVSVRLQGGPERAARAAAWARVRRFAGSDTYRSLHRGARAFAEGLYAAIRNPGMHTPPPADGGEEQLALEQLAAFSLLARWVDQAATKKV